MKRFFYLLSAVAMVAAIVACEKAPTPDGNCALESISITKALNSSISADINGVIDGSTITFTIPSDAIGQSFIPTFKATKYDVVTIGGVEAESGVTSCSIADGTKIEVADEISALNASYTVSVKENDGQAVLLSIAIAKESDDAIAEDIVADEIASEMILRVPGAAFQKSLTIKATAGKNDVIKINGEIAQDGQATVDTKFPVDIEVSDETAGAKQAYVLKVGKILENVWKLAGTYSNNQLSDYVDLAVDAAADVPYIVTSENKLGDDGTTVAITQSATVIKYENGAIVPVGSQCFSEGKSTYSNIDVVAGVPYVSFVDGNKSSYVSCMSYSDGSWNYVGNAGFGPKITGLSYYRFDMIIDPATKYPVVGLALSAATSGLAKRSLAVSAYDGTAWEAFKGVNGRTQVYCYNIKFARSNDAVYLLAANQTEKTFSLYKYKDRSWSVLVADLKIEGTTDICTYFADLECDSQGNVYAAIGDNSSGNYICQLYKFDGTNLVKAYNPVAGAFFDKTYCQWSLTFDSSDRPVLAYISSNSGDAPYPVYVASIDPDTKDWATPVILGTSSKGTYLSAGRADNGNIYVSYSTTSEDKVNTIYLHKYSIEDDILPE